MLKILSILVAFFVAAPSCLSLAEEQPPKEGPESQQQNITKQSGADDNRAIAEPSFLPMKLFTANGQKEIAEYCRSNGEREIKDWSHKYICDIRITDAYIALFTFTLAAVTIGLIIVGFGTIRTMARTERRQLRAYVGIEKIELVFRANVQQIEGAKKGEIGWIWPDVLLVHYRNFGQTPASRVYIHVNWEPMKFGVFLPDSFTYPDRFSAWYEGAEPIMSYEFVDGGQPRTTSINIDDASVFKEAKAKRAWNVYVYGHIDFTDIYGSRWQRNYCYLYEPWGPRIDPFVSHAEHNNEKYLGRDPFT